jgi:hypothetical protein
MAPMQLHTNAKEEITMAIQNYEIIIDEVNALDSDYECQHTQDLLYAIFKCCIPNLATELESLTILERDRIHIKELIQTLDRLKKAKTTKDIPVDDNMSHESPIVHLLCLAVEKQVISYSREHRSEGENWGGLGAFSDYLKKLEFKKAKDENGAPYWPGLPTCIMAYVPIWAPQMEYHISVSASPDGFVYALRTKKILWKIRRRRLHRLREQCDKGTTTRIDAVRQFSKELCDDSKWKTLFKPTDGFENIDHLGPHSWRPHDLKPHDSVPFYLPIVNSTWNPSGKYLRACPLDSLRFAVLRPPEAEKIEQSPRHSTPKKVGGKLPIPSESSCAEWDGFLNVMSQPRYTKMVWC